MNVNLGIILYCIAMFLLVGVMTDKPSSNPGNTCEFSLDCR
jgi:hypothetical protein